MVTGLFIFVLLCVVADARVTFTHSEVLQPSDIATNNRAPFKCNNGCHAYTDSKSRMLSITEYNEKTKVFDVVVKFANMGGTFPIARDPYKLKAGSNYFIENRGEASPEFVFYVVDSKSPNLNTAVLVENEGTTGNQPPNGIFTILHSNIDRGLMYSHLDGVFQPGYPRVYTTGFDAVAEEECRPLYQARSPETTERSPISVYSPISTVDFGSKLNRNPGAVYIRTYYSGSFIGNSRTSAVYASPGYVGCSYNQDQSYTSNDNSVLESFSINVKTLDLDAAYYIPNANEALRITVNNEEFALSGNSSLKRHYEAAQFSVTIDWSHTNPAGSFAIQFDLGIPQKHANDMQEEATTMSAQGVFSVVSLFIAVSILLQ